MRAATAVLFLAAVGCVLVGSTVAFATDDDRWLDDYRDRLRREIAQRARELRDVKSGNYDGDRYRSMGSRNTRDRSTSRGGDKRGIGGADIFQYLGDPFGPPAEFAPPPDWLSGGGDGKKGPAGPVDLSGQQIGTMQTGAVLPAAPVELTEEEKKEREEAKKEAEKEETERTAAGAQLLVDNGEYAAARRMLVPIAASRRRTEEEVTTAKDLMARIDTLAMKRLTEADEAVANKDIDKAAEIYDEVAAKFGAAPAAALARHRLVVLKEDPDIASRFLLQTAKSYVARKRLDQALPLLREIATSARYAEAKYRKAAEELLKELEQRAAVEGQLTDDQVLAARKWLIIGNIHALNGRVERAVDSYERVIQEFDDTKYADAARAKIAELKNEDK